MDSVFLGCENGCAGTKNTGRCGNTGCGLTDGFPDSVCGFPCRMTDKNCLISDVVAAAGEGHDMTGLGGAGGCRRMNTGNGKRRAIRIQSG